MDAAGGCKGEDRTFFQVEGHGTVPAAHEQRGECTEVRFVANEGQAFNGIGLFDTIGDLGGVILGPEARRFDQGVVQLQAVGKEARGFERADEGAVPEVGGAQRAVALEKRHEPGAFLAAAVTERTQRIIRGIGGVGVADQKKLHSAVLAKTAGVGESGMAFPPLERLASGQSDFLPRENTKGQTLRFKSPARL
jgi:hypothetical protein